MNTLNFLNTKMTDIGPDFISSSVIICLNFTNNYIENIAHNAFTNLPNLTYLFLVNNYLKYDNYYSSYINFGGHEKLNVLVLNNTVFYTYYSNGKYVPDTTIKRTAVFGNYPNLEILSVRNSCLSDLRAKSKTSQSSSVTQVEFPKLKILDLSGNFIGYSSRLEFMNLLSNSLQFLDLHNNNLNYLTLNEKGSNLLVLNVDNNNFQYVYKLSYNGLSLGNLKNLQYLSISNNRIHTIELGAFQDTNKLIYLNLSTNSISKLDSDTFANLHSLDTLDLSFNQLNYVPQILKSTNIKILHLSCNKIEKIISYDFAQSPKLIKLLLGGNRIDEIDVDAFDFLYALEKLDLSRNKLSSLPEGWTAFLTSLKYLDLSDNMFTSLESLSLTNTLSLIDLYLAMNSLEYLNIKYFKNLPQNLTVHWTQQSNFAQLYKC
ncbi:leucine-rich repeat-containing protein egg-6 isoform X1 [Linepithema humile]|uniref:leucine-rich repeat-containing protein egg-6 isoform X1 n=1 Tax=Linepithema humile TaxID=83485 RepID=UPI00351F2297